MELIRKLPTRINKNGHAESWGLFKCPDIYCGKEVEMRITNGYKAKTCWVCKPKSIIKHGWKNTLLYNTWAKMKNRCKNKASKYWGSKGITVCDEWLEFIPFRDWALSHGYKEKEGLILDREDPNGKYEPDNCRFITILESNRNKTTTTTMEIANEIRYLDSTGEYTQKELAEKYNISEMVVSNIINNKNWK